METAHSAKPLLIFAHRGEAKAFLLKDSPISLSDFEGRLYESDHYFLLICSEGATEAMFYSTAIISKYHKQISKIINLGIAGQLDKHHSIPLGPIYSPRTIYFHDGHKMQFTSFENNKDSTLDLITTSSRILDKKSRDYLSKFGTLVDREAWGIAYTCQKMRKVCEVWKLSSDNAAEGEICQRIKEDAKQYSLKLYDFFQNTRLIAPSHSKKESIQGLPEGFHFSKFQTSQFTHLVSLFDEYPHNIIKDVQKSYKKIGPKKKAQILIEYLKDHLDPFTSHIKKEVNRLSEKFQNDQFKMTYDPKCESSDIWIKAHIRNLYDFQTFKKRLENFPYANICNLLEKGPNVS